MPDGATALAWAVYLGDRESADLLLAAGANVKTADEYGESPLTLAAANNQTRFAPGEAFSLVVRPSEDAHVYCYLQDEKAKITRFYPNRFAKDSLVLAAKPLTLPGAMRFQLAMNPKGVKETVSCFATKRDVSTALPGTMLGTDFEPLVVASIDQIRNAFAAATGGAVAEETFHVQAK